MTARFPLLSLLAFTACALIATSCRPGPPDDDLSPAQLTARRIDRGEHRVSIPPTTIVSTPGKQYRVGDNVPLTVRVIAPAEDEALDPYLPIRGTLHLKRDGATFELQPHASARDLIWAELPADVRRERERVFTININHVFPMTETGWYVVWWEGRDDFGHQLRSADAYVQVLVQVPSEGD